MRLTLLIFCAALFGLMEAPDLFASDSGLWHSFPPFAAQTAGLIRMSEALVAGMLLISQIFYLSLLVQHRENRGEAWLFIFSFVAFFRLLSSGHLLNFAFAGNFPPQWFPRFEYASLGLFVFCLAGFTRRSLGLGRRTMSMGWAASILYAFTCLSTTLVSHGWWRFLGLAIALYASFLIIAMHFEALREKNALAWFSLVGFLALFAAECHDILAAQEMIAGRFPCRPYGLALLILSQGQIMAQVLLQKIDRGPGSQRSGAPQELDAENQENRERDIVREIAATSHETFCVFMSSLSRILDDADRVVDMAMERETEVMRRLFLLISMAEIAAEKLGLVTLKRQLSDLEQICTTLLRSNKIYWNSVNLHTEIEGVRRLLRLYLRLNSEKLGRSIESIADLLVETKYLNAHQPVLSRAEERLPELEKARHLAEERFESVAIGPLPPILEDILQQSQRQATLYCELQIRCGTAIRVPFETQRLLRKIFEEIARNSFQHAFAGDRSKQPRQLLEVDATLDKNSLRLTIRDSGRGLSISELRQEGQRFGLVSNGMSAQDLADLLLNVNYKQEKRGLLRLQRLLNECGGEIRVELLSEVPQGQHHPFLIIVHLPFSLFQEETLSVSAIA